MENIFDKSRKRNYTIALTIIYGLIIFFAIITMQLLVGLVIATIVTVFAISAYFIDQSSLETENQNVTLMLACGVIVAAVAYTLSAWLLWAVTFAILFLLLHIFSRIEQRIARLEYQSTRRVLHRRTRGGASQRHRA